MLIQLPLAIQTRVDLQLQRPEFGNIEEVLTAALDALEQKQTWRKKMRAFAQVGLDDIAAGRCGPLDAEEIKRAYRQMTTKDG